MDNLIDTSWTRFRVKQHPSLNIGVILYDEVEFRRLRALPSVASMTEHDFESFVDNCIAMFGKVNYEGDPATPYYRISMMGDLAAQLGYNPFFNNQEIGT